MALTYEQMAALLGGSADEPTADPKATDTAGAWSDVALQKAVLDVLGFTGDALVAAGAVGSLSAKNRRISQDLSDVLGRFPAPVTPGQGIAYGSLTRQMSVQLVDNGTTLDVVHGTKEFVMLASGLRTATTNTPDFINNNGHGLVYIVDITAASGTGGLTTRLQMKHPITGNYISINAAPTAAIAVSTLSLFIYPGGTATSGNWTQAAAGVLPRTFRVQVVHGDTSNYTYSIAGVLLP